LSTLLFRLPFGFCKQPQELMIVVNFVLFVANNKLITEPSVCSLHSLIAAALDDDRLQHKAIASERAKGSTLSSSVKRLNHSHLPFTSFAIQIGIFQFTHALQKLRHKSFQQTQLTNASFAIVQQKHEIVTQN